MIVVAIIGLLAAIAIPNFTKARMTAQKNTCITNLKMIDNAAQQWALEYKKVETETYSLTDGTFLDFIKGSILPACPSGGTYTPGANVASQPSCSLSSLGHSL